MCYLVALTNIVHYISHCQLIKPYHFPIGIFVSLNEDCKKTEGYLKEQLVKGMGIKSL